MPRPGSTSTEHWRAVQPFLPDGLRVTEDAIPTEEWHRLGGFLVHADRYVPGVDRSVERPVLVVVLHGGGANGGYLSPFGVMVRRLGHEALIPDLPGFGVTQVPDKRSLRYQDWVDTVSELVVEEARDRPVVVLGLSMGGMLAFDVAGRTGLPRAVVASCLLDPSDAEVRRGMARAPWIGSLARPLLRRTAWVSDRLPVPMRLVAPVRKVVGNSSAARAVAGDPLAGGTWMPGGWLRTYLGSGPSVAPEDFDVCPVVLTHPAADTWTPVDLSLPFFRRIAGPRRLVMLEGASHGCVEEPGVWQLEATLRQVMEDALRAPGTPAGPARPRP